MEHNHIPTCNTEQFGLAPWLAVVSPILRWPDTRGIPRWRDACARVHTTLLAPRHVPVPRRPVSLLRCTVHNFCNDCYRSWLDQYPWP